MLGNDFENDGKPWTEAEESWLREHFGFYSRQQCALKLGRTEASISNRASMLKISSGVQKIRYKKGVSPVRPTDEPTQSKPAITLTKEEPKKRVGSGRFRALNDDEIQFLTEHHNKDSLVEIADALNVDKGRLSQYVIMLKNMGKLDKKTIVKNRGRVYEAIQWSDNETERLVSLYGAGYTYDEISKELGRTKSQVGDKLYRLRVAGDLPKPESKKEKETNKRDNKSSSPNVSLVKFPDAPRVQSRAPFIECYPPPPPRQIGIFSRFWRWMFGDPA